MIIYSDKIIGNINSDPLLKEKYLTMLKMGAVEKIEITRLESERSRLRKTSDKGTDLALTLTPGTHLGDGDVVLLTEERMILAKRVPENVAMISLRDNISADHLLETAVKIGHTIGNMHRPIKFENGKIYFPIQAESEVELFRKLLFNLRDHLDIKSERIVFEPEPGYNIHEH